MSSGGAHIACGRCTYYFVTFDVQRPHGCKKFGFKSQRSPSLEVFTATGTKCAQFNEKFTPSRRASEKTVRRRG